jgi:hypothetical protein
MNIELKRKVHVYSYEAIMDIGIESDRDDILAVLELGKGRQINPQMVNEELLFRPENSSHGRRILEVINSYGLIKEAYSNNYELTDAGEKALENMKVKIPEKGIYVLHLTKDPLFPDRILRYGATNKKPWEEFRDTRHNFHNKNKDKSKKQKPPKGIPKPECLNKYKKGSVVKLAGKSNEEIQINEIGDKLFKADSKLNVFVNIRLDEQNTSVKVVSSDEKEIAIDSPFTLKPTDVLNELFGNIQEAKGKLVLPVSYDEINDAEKRGMIRRDIIEMNKTIDGFEKFSQISVDEISLMPKSELDAEKWAKWHLRNSINYYFDEKTYLTKMRDAAGKFVDFYDQSEIESAFPDFDDFVKEVAEIEPKTANYWYARAPIDLNME